MNVPGEGNGNPLQYPQIQLLKSEPLSVMVLGIRTQPFLKQEVGPHKISNMTAS